MAAKLLAAAGAHVILSGRDAERGQTVSGELGDGGNVRFVQADLASVTALAALAGLVDILINNAGALPP